MPLCMCELAVARIIRGTMPLIQLCAFAHCCSIFTKSYQIMIVLLAYGINVLVMSIVSITENSNNSLMADKPAAFPK